MNLKESYSKINEADRFIEKTKRQMKFWQIFTTIYVVTHIITLIYIIFIK